MPLNETIHLLTKEIIMADKIEETVNEEKKTNKVVNWFKDHKKTVRDIAIGAGAVGALVFLTNLGKKSSEEELEEADSDSDYSSEIEASPSTPVEE
jgi:hypothetical protein